MLLSPPHERGAKAFHPNRCACHRAGAARERGPDRLGPPVVEPDMTDKPQFTPAPWVSQGWIPTWAYIPIKDARFNVICAMYPDVAHNYTREEVAANARLII